MNDTWIYQKFQSYANNTGDVEGPWFEKASELELAVLTQLYDTCLAHSAVWAEHDIYHLRELKIPESMVQFYQEMNPTNVPMNDAGLYLADLNRMRDEYTQLVPGCYLIKFGFMVIATTIGGNSILADLYDEHTAIYICDHNLLSLEQENGQSVLSYVFPPETLQEQYEENPIPVNRTTLVQCLIPIEESFEDFMTKLSRNEYEFDLEDLLE